MLGGLSDSSLGSWSFWLQVLGLAGAIGLLVSLVGVHLVNREISARAHRNAAGMAPAAERVATPPMEKPKVEISLTKPGLAKPAPVKPVVRTTNDTSPSAIMSEMADAPKPPPREITETQRSAFVSELIDAPKRPLQVITYDRDPEIQSYADQIRVMLVLAGYNCGTEVRVSPAPSTPPAGVLIVVKNPARAPSFAGAIQNAFKAVGIDALGAKDDDFADDQVAVVVGKRKE